MTVGGSSRGSIIAYKQELHVGDSAEPSAPSPGDLGGGQCDSLVTWDCVQGFGDSLGLYFKASDSLTLVWLPGFLRVTMLRLQGQGLHILVDDPGFGTVAQLLNSVPLPEASESGSCQLEFRTEVCPSDAIFPVISGATLCKAGTDPAQSLNPPNPVQVCVIL